MNYVHSLLLTLACMGTCATSITAMQMTKEERTERRKTICPKEYNNRRRSTSAPEVKTTPETAITPAAITTPKKISKYKTSSNRNVVKKAMYNSYQVTKVVKELKTPENHYSITRIPNNIKEKNKQIEYLYQAAHEAEHNIEYKRGSHYKEDEGEKLLEKLQQKSGTNLEEEEEEEEEENMAGILFAEIIGTITMHKNNN